MQKWTKENMIFIMASMGYNRKQLENKGVKVFQPYRGRGIAARLLREACFRLPFLPKTVWYRKDVLQEKPQYINLFDVLITRHYLCWLKSRFPESRINYLYFNMIGRARNMKPDQIPEGINVWTYDDYDSRKYGIRLYRHYWINDDLLRIRRQPPEYDIFFVGRDKGRGEELLALENRMQGMGLKTKFIITRDGKFSPKKPYYQPEISYDEVLRYDSVSRAVLNIIMENQEGVTLRDIEAAAIGIKLITTNRNIVNKDLYNRNNVFILGEDDLDRLPEFIRGETADVISGIRDSHTMEAWLDEITASDEGCGTC